MLLVVVEPRGISHLSLLNLLLYFTSKKSTSSYACDSMSSILLYRKTVNVLFVDNDAANNNQLLRESSLSCCLVVVDKNRAFCHCMRSSGTSKYLPFDSIDRNYGTARQNCVSYQMHHWQGQGASSIIGTITMPPHLIKNTTLLSSSHLKSPLVLYKTCWTHSFR